MAAEANLPFAARRCGRRGLRALVRRQGSISKGCRRRGTESIIKARRGPKLESKGTKGEAPFGKARKPKVPLVLPEAKQCHRLLHTRVFRGKGRGEKWREKAWVRRRTCSLFSLLSFPLHAHRTPRRSKAPSAPARRVFMQRLGPSHCCVLTSLPPRSSGEPRALQHLRRRRRRGHGAG